VQIIGNTSFEAFTTVMFQVDVFWIVTPCSFVTGHQRFRVPCCLHFTLKKEAAQHYTALQPRRPRYEIDK